MKNLLRVLVLANALAYLFVTGSDVNLVAAVVIAPFALFDLLNSRRALVSLSLVLSTVAIIAVPSSAFAKPAHQSKKQPIHCKATQRIRRKVVKVKGKRKTKLVCVAKPS